MQNTKLQRLTICLVIGFSLFFRESAFSQDWQVFEQISGTALESVEAIEAGEAGIFFLGGIFETEANVSGELFQGFGGDDIFIRRKDEAGGNSWLSPIGGSFNDHFGGLQVANEGLYVAGGIIGTAHFDTILITPQINSTALFLTNYSLEGTLAWVKLIEGNGLKICSGLAQDDQGDLYMYGYFSNDLFGNNWALQGDATVNGFVVKYTDAGDFVWAESFGVNGDARVLAGTVYDDHLVLSGSIEGHFLFGPDSIYSNTNDNDFFLLQMDLEGTAEWGLRAGGVLDDQVADVKVKDGIFLTGNFKGVFKLDEQNILSTNGVNEDLFLLKYQEDGTLAWATQAGGSSAFEFGTSIDFWNDEIVLTGYYRGSSPLGSGSLLEHNMFVGRWNQVGDFLWVSSMEGSGDDFSNTVLVSQDDVYLGGTFADDLAFSGEILQASNAFDGLVLKANLSFWDGIELINDKVITQVLPNPFSDQLLINIQGDDSSVFRWEFFDLSGKKLKEGNSYLIEFEESFPSGMYFLKVQIGDQSQIHKMIKP